LPVAAAAQDIATAPEPATATAAPKKIQDNLFLMEEAYNQEAGVIQHIQLFQLDPQTHAWSYALTDEWPLLDQRNQISLTVPVNRLEDERAEIADVWLNYRVQALMHDMGNGDQLAVAPRLSLSIPFGNPDEGAGRGGSGIQLAIPASLDLGPQFTVHANAGVTITPGARNTAGNHASTLDTTLGAALVWLPLSKLNAFVECLYITEADVIGDAKTDRRHSFIVSPALRAAVDFDSGLQVVPGLAMPVEMTSDETVVSAILYLSLEHPLWEPTTAKP